MSSGAATTTSGGGHYSFLDVEGGTYTVTISGYPGDASFSATTAEVTIATSGQMAGANFSGSWIRTASLMGMVTVEGMGLPGITVSISGRQEAQMLTDDNGQYTFTGLRAGNYTVEISGFDATDVGFSATSNAIEVAVGESEVWSFDGTYVRESTIAGQVSVEGNGLSDVTVSLQGMGADESEMTDMGGQFTFSNLRAGEYQLAISGYDTNEYGFSTTSATVRVEHGRTANVPFEGIMLRTAAIMGQVSVEGEGLGDVTVSLSGEGESLTTMTDESGQYAFSDLPAGNFQVGISGYDTDDFSFEATSKNVALALGETATVPFEGILLRTSGISGRVSVEGHGLDSVMVTLSGDDLEEDMTVMTDASGQYAIAGLAEGDYTVAISGYNAVAYIFEMTSMDVTLGDDDTQIVNFMGAHARTASVSGMIFADEAAKNDSYDEGEHAIPAPGVVLALVGPGILDQTPGATGPDGSFAFGNLRAGPYQLVVANTAAAGPDLAYGGPAEGYAIILGVGDAATQNVPFDITHTTINFTVSLKSGDKSGAALPGATVTLYSDLAGELKITDEETGDDGMASMRIARAGTTGNTVYAAVAAPAGSYHTDGDMQAVMWNPQMTMAADSNAADIVNTMADFSFGGATVMTDMGGGKALGGWKVEVTSGGSAVAGAPGALGANGMASHSEMVDAGDLPKTYTIAMAGWKDQANDSTGDGGERYTSTTVEHTHHGLSLAGTSTDAGTMEVTYTTQTLKAYVHHERDQVEGYTGNVLGADERMSGIVDVSIRHIDGDGRARTFAPTDSVKPSVSGGVYTFRNVPASADVVVRAQLSADAENVMLLNNVGKHQDEFDAFRNAEANGIMGGAFGAEGGFNHTVELCPLMSLEDHQRHGDCGTFAFVNTYHVFGQVWEWGHAKSGSGFATNASKMGVVGTTLSLEPVEGENLAGDPESYTAAASDNRATSGIDDRLQFDWGRIAEGEYELEVPSSWRARVGPPEDASGSAADSVSPLQDDLHIDLSPATGYAYGVVTDAGTGQPLEGVTVNVNGVSATTDEHGRYVARGFYARTIRRTGENFTRRNRTQISTSEDGATPTTVDYGFAANSPRRHDIAINMARITRISGSVTKSGTGDGIANVRIWIDGKPPLNAREYSHPTNRFATIMELRTGADGSYEAHVDATGGTVEVTVSRDGMFFSPANHTVTAAENASISGINFTGFDNVSVSGRVVEVQDNGDSTAVSGVRVIATPTSGASARADTAYSSATGSYTLSLPYGQYSVAASRSGYTLAPATQSINVPGTEGINNFVVTGVDETNATLSSLNLSGVTLCRTTACPSSQRGFRSSVMDYTATVGNSTTMTTVSATASVDGADVDIYPEDADSFEPGHQVELEIGDNTIEVTVTALDETSEERYAVVVDRRNESTTITGTITDAVSGNGVNRVSIRVDGAYVINANHFVGGQRAIRTGSDGTYELIVESTGSTATVIPVSSTRSFTPTGRTVTTTPNSTISAIDFTGAQHGTIMGTVEDANGDAIEGATVTATNGSSTRSASTSRQGSFTITRVPTGTVTITAARTGYMFDSQNVFVGPGATVSIGAIEGSASADASLSSVTVNGDDVEAGPDGNYATDVANDVTMATIVATPTDNGDDGAQVAYSGTDADAATDGHQVALAAGAAIVTTVTVTAADGTTTKEYTVTVMRMSSEDVSLSSLTVDGTALDADMDGNYAMDVTNDVTMATIVATPTDADAMVAYTGTTDADATTDGHQVALNVGVNVTTVTVTASDGMTSKAYTVTVTRGDGHQAPSAPIGFEVTAGDQSATLTWAAPRQIGSSVIVGYGWEATAPGQPTVGSGETNLAADATTVDAEGLTNGATYTFSVWAVNTKGDPPVNVRGTAATATAKAQPIITLTTTGDLEEGDETSSITAEVALTNSSTEDITVTVEEVFAEGDTEMRSQVDIENPTIVIRAGSTTPAAGTDATTITAVDDVFAEDAQTALVQATSDDAVDSDSDGDATNDVQAPNEITINDATDPDVAPGAPRNLTVDAGDTELSVEWQSPADAGSSDITHYEIRYALTADIDDATWAPVTGGAAARTMVITELTNDSGYTVHVRAVSDAGASDPPASETGTPSGS